MNILVCISNVPDTTSKINFQAENTEFDKNGVQFIINPNDEFGLTRAIWLQQKQGAQVTVVTVGDATSEVILRKCLAIGADNAIRVDTNPKDGFAVAKELQAICANENYDLIITGRESIDYNGGMVGAMLATLLEYSFLTNQASLEREIDGGKEVSKATLPLVIGGQKGLVEESDLIIPNMRGIMQARKKPLEVVAPSGEANATEITTFQKPPAKGAVRLIDAEDIDTLIDLLQNEAKVL